MGSQRSGGARACVKQLIGSLDRIAVADEVSPWFESWWDGYISDDVAYAVVVDEQHQLAVKTFRPFPTDQPRIPLENTVAQIGHYLDRAMSSPIPTSTATTSVGSVPQ